MNTTREVVNVTEVAVGDLISAPTDTRPTHVVRYAKMPVLSLGLLETGANQILNLTPTDLGDNLARYTQN